MERSLELEAVIALMEYDFNQFEIEIQELGAFSLQLYQSFEKADPSNPYFSIDLSNLIINSEPDANPDLSTVYISELTPDLMEVKELLIWSSPLDERFKQVIQNNPTISQVYFNSGLQVGKLFPPYPAKNNLEADLDLTEFNFYYEALAENNPTGGFKWVSDIYLDPVGKGWMVSLIYPVYHDDELLFVLGFDITLKEIIENYINQYSKQMIIIDATGTLVAGKSRAIEALSLPPLKDHTYSQTIISDSFRPEQFNLFKSKNQLVRSLVSDILLGNKREFNFQNDFDQFSGVVKKFDKMDWYLVDLTWR
ncbi:PDC sensor domain-containing protein [Mongoliitalea daihaiensis]|uniref:PDC sensor domain-containing protein n=1 Tax=Mongoliitalea daihaiensis TaxID=2782006 RepID=UPI001F2742BB|nr:PDC sensor domain-containing protein [Mongoliitalea daihaiensis]UJP63726.1 Cache sensor protein [Mongoliitalea daihaiensis]